MKSKQERVRLSPKEYAFALAVGLAVGLAGCTGTPGASETSTSPEASPSASLTGEAAYLDAAERPLDIVLDTEGAFEQFPEMRQAALDVADTTCSALAEGTSEEALRDRLIDSIDAGGDVKSAQVIGQWITAAIEHVC